MAIDWEAIASEATAALKLIEPILTAADPAAGAALTVAEKIAQGVLAAEPVAVALFDQIKSGKIPTPDELKAAMDAYETSYQTLRSDIAAKLAAHS